MAVYDYRIPWLLCALSYCEPPNLATEDDSEDKDFPQFSTVTKKPTFGSTPYISTLGNVDNMVCRWDVITSQAGTIKTKRIKVPYRGPLRLRMYVNFNVGIRDDQEKLQRLLELKPINQGGNCDEYGIFSLKPFTQGAVITLKFPGEDTEESNRPLNFGATFMRHSDGESLLAIARITHNGVIRALVDIAKGAEIILESSNRPNIHPVDFLDRLIVCPNSFGEFFVPKMGRVKNFKTAGDGKVSYIVQIGHPNCAKEEVIDQEQLIRRSVYLFGSVPPETTALSPDLLHD